MRERLKSIHSVASHELKWSQPNAIKMEYELHDGLDLVGTLRFRSSFGSFATAENGDGSWTFKRAGFLKTRAIIRCAGSDQDLAIFRNRTWSHGGTLELSDGRRYPANTNFWRTAFEFKTEKDELLVRFRKIRGVLHLSSLIDIQPAARSLIELPWIVPLGWYLTVMMQRDDSEAGIGGAAVS